MSNDKWIKDVHESSAAKELPEGLFKQSPEEIARVLKEVTMKKDSDDPFRSAMSMLDFYINRAGDVLSSEDKGRLEQAKVAIRKIFGKD